MRARALVLAALAALAPARASAKTCRDESDAIGFRHCTHFGWSWSREEGANLDDAGAWLFEGGYSRARVALPADGWLRVIGAAGWTSAITSDRAGVVTDGPEVRVVRISPSNLEIGGALVLRWGTLPGAGGAVAHPLGEALLGVIVGRRLPLGRISLRAEAVIGTRLLGLQPLKSECAAGCSTTLGFAPLLQPRIVVDVWPSPQFPISAYVDADPFGVREIGFGVLLGISTKSYAGAK